MSYVIRRAAIVLAAASAAAWLSGTVGAEQGAGKRNPEAAKIQNPVRSTPESIAAGKKTYDSYCVGCHAPDGKGGLVLSITEDKGLPPPATLSDNEWDHGGSDGEIYAVIRDGVPPDYIMGPWKDRLQEQDIWNLVNYLKSLSVQK
jgi:mono/diheme cytochrome c family protein